MTQPIDFSRPIAVQQLGAGENRMRIEATPSERESLARRFNLVGLESLNAQLRLRRIGGSRLVRLHGRLQADVVQTCVVSLQEVRSHVDETFEMLYGPPEDIMPDGVDVMVNIDEDDPPEPIRHGLIDTGEAVAEHLALALDPFPRAPGARLDPALTMSDEPPEPHPNQFSALESIKKNRE